MSREQAILSVRTKTNVENLPNVIGKIYQEIWEYLEEKNELICDMPFTIYHNMNMSNLDVEIGVPVAKLLGEKGNLKSRVMPSEKCIYCMYRGAYKEIEPVYIEMEKWIKDNGHEVPEVCYEYYYNKPSKELPESEMITKIVIPLK